MIKEQKQPSLSTMDTKAGGFQEPRYLDFPKSDKKTADGKPILNRYSTDLTNHHDFPGAKV